MWFLNVTYYLSTYCFLLSMSNSIFECWEPQYCSRKSSCLAKARSNLPFSNAITMPTPAASLRQPRTHLHSVPEPGRRGCEPRKTFPTSPSVPRHRASYVPTVRALLLPRSLRSTGAASGRCRLRRQSPFGGARQD